MEEIIHHGGDFITGEISSRGRLLIMGEVINHGIMGVLPELLDCP